MTLEEAKNEVAKTHGCEYWGDLLQQVHVGKLKGDIETYSDEAAFLYAESKVKNLAQPDVIRSFFCLSTGNQPEYKRACMNQCSWCKEHQHQFQQAQIDKMTVTIKTTIIHEVQKNGV